MLVVGGYFRRSKLPKGVPEFRLMGQLMSKEVWEKSWKRLDPVDLVVAGGDETKFIHMGFLVTKELYRVVNISTQEDFYVTLEVAERLRAVNNVTVLVP